MPAMTMGYTPDPNAGLVRNADGKMVKRTGIWGDIDQGQQALAGAVTGYGEMLKPELLQTLGTTLGGINSIGGLRSGAVPVALNDIATSYGNQVGAFAAQTATAGAELGINVRDHITAAKRQRDAKRAALLGSLGSVLGAGIALIPGIGIPAKAAVKTITSNGGGMA